jgi:hypothetical protein
MRLQVLRRQLDGGAFPERVAVGQQHIAGGHQRRALEELVVGVDTAHRHRGGQGGTHAGQAGQQLGFWQLAAQQHLVADRGDVDHALLPELDQGSDLTFVALAVGADPGPDHGLQSLCARQPRDRLVALGAGKAPQPARVRGHDVDAPGQVRGPQRVAGPLARHVGRQAQAVEPGLQLLRMERADLLDRQARQRRRLGARQQQAMVGQPGPRPRAPGGAGRGAGLAPLELGVHLAGALLVEVVVAHQPHGQQVPKIGTPE